MEPCAKTQTGETISESTWASIMRMYDGSGAATVQSILYCHVPPDDSVTSSCGEAVPCRFGASKSFTWAQGQVAGSGGLTSAVNVPPGDAWKLGGSYIKAERVSVGLSEVAPGRGTVMLFVAHWPALHDSR